MFDSDDTQDTHLDFKPMTVDHPRWDEFIQRLMGPQFLDVQLAERAEEYTSRCCGDRRHAIDLLVRLRNIDVETSLAYVDEHGGFTDDEIWMNVDPPVCDGCRAHCAEQTSEDLCDSLVKDTNTNTYRWRAECRDDNERLLEILPRGELIRYVTSRSQFPGEECALTVRNLSLDDLRDLMRKITDGHVMIQTVNHAQKYTGERDYDAE